jgi:hypothetical protein
MARFVPRAVDFPRVALNPLIGQKILMAPGIFPEWLGDPRRRIYYPNRYRVRFYSRQRRER